jgi:ketosteroid isomerase-like protein
MQGIRQPDDSPSIAVVRALFLAYREGRLDDLLALVHPAVVWQPITRPGRSVYVGHAGTRDLMQDLTTAMGEFRVEFGDYGQLPDGRVTAHVRIIRQADGHDGAEQGARVVLTLRDGLVVGLESADEPERAVDGDELLT